MQKMVNRYKQIVNQEPIMCTWCYHAIKKDEVCLQGYGDQKWHLTCKPTLKSRIRLRLGHGHTGQRRLARDLL
jgi:hypothetical protein